MHTSRRHFVRTAVLLAATALVATGCSGGSGSNAGPPADQAIVVGGFNYTTLDAGVSGSTFISASLPVAIDIYGALFDPAKTEGGDFTPDLATGYTYNADRTELTITLRKGLTFQDGTPFDAEAVAFNFTRGRDNPSVNTEFMSEVKEAKAVDDVDVKVTFTAPNTNFISILTYTSAGLIGSPTAIEKDEKGFGLKPIGAGPFQVVSMNPGEEMVVEPFDKFWDAANVHLDEIRYINTSADAQVAYQHVVSGSVDSVQVSGTGTPANTFDDAHGNKDIALVAGLDNSFTFLPINTYKPPFNKIEARQAIDYCTDRDAIAKNVAGGWANPAYVVAGPDTFYYPDGGVEGAKALFPYKYDPAKGTELVKQLGGLSFSFFNIGGQHQVVAQALAQQWKACGIDAAVESVTGPKIKEAYSNGNYQMVYTPSGGLSDPAFGYSFQQATTPQGSWGFAREHPEVPALMNSAKRTSDKQQLETIWRQFFDQVNKLAVTIPVLSAPNYYFMNKCLTGVDQDRYGQSFRFASLTC